MVACEIWDIVCCEIKQNSTEVIVELSGHALNFWILMLFIPVAEAASLRRRMEHLYLARRTAREGWNVKIGAAWVAIPEIEEEGRKRVTHTHIWRAKNVLITHPHDVSCFNFFCDFLSDSHFSTMSFSSNSDSTWHISLISGFAQAFWLERLIRKMWIKYGTVPIISPEVVAAGLFDELCRCQVPARAECKLELW